MRSQRVASFFLFCSAAFAFTGCAERLVEVSGTVTVDGKAVQDGAITFIPVDGTTSGTAGSPIKDGQYAFKSHVGRMKVAISASKQVGTKPLYGPGSKERPIFEPLLSRKYSDQNDTVLEYDVTPGPNRKDWILKSD
jgi:hypothetical protein